MTRGAAASSRASVACVIRVTSNSRLYLTVTPEAHPRGFHPIDTVGGDGQHASVEPLDPALLPQIPEVKIQVLGGAADDTREFHLAHARLPCRPPTLTAQQR